MQIVNHRLQGVNYVASPNVGGFIDPKFVIMHYTAGWTAESAINTLCSPAAKVSAHFVIDRDGEITQLVPLNRAAWHAGPSKYQGVVGLNNHSIGIEIVNPGWLKPEANGTYSQGKARFDADDVKGYDLSIKAPHARVGGGTFVWPGYTPEQIKALDELFTAICEAYPIQDVTGHENIDTRGWKTDPGPAFPMGRYKTALHNTHDRSDGLHRAKLGDVNVPRLNVRAGPSATSKIVTTLLKGHDVTILEKQGAWLHVEFAKGQTGYVSAQYVKEIS